MAGPSVESRVGGVPAADIAAAMAALGIAGPALVVADAAAIAVCAPAWARSFAAAGIVHRVVASGVDAVAAAADLTPRVVFVAGCSVTRAAAAEAAAAFDAPLIECADVAP